MNKILDPKLKDSTTKPKCGIVMPISGTEDCSAEHWVEVLGILKDVINGLNFDPNLVSDADEIGIIQKRIIQNLYNNEIVVCDVSAKNPNVMFELGMRLAFDKPTIIIKDDKTDYSFDTSVIEHLTYPRDLRFGRIVDFKENLKKKIEATYNKSINDPNFSTFLKNFGQYKIAHLQETEVSPNDYIISSLNEIRTELTYLKKGSQHLTRRPQNPSNTMTIDEYLENKMKDFAVSVNVKELADLDLHVDELTNQLYKETVIKQIYSDSSELRKKLLELIPPF